MQRTEVAIPPRMTGDSGSVMAEFALVTPFLVFLVLGIFEFGTAWRNSNIIGASLRSSARTAAQAQNSPTADMLALQAYQGAIAQGKNITTNKVIIYKVILASNPTATVPPSCVTASTAGATPYGVNFGYTLCNVYTPAQMTSANLVPANFGCGGTKYDGKWCPTSRSNILPGPGPDTVGVWASVTYKYMTKLLPGGSMTITDKAVSRIEPDSA